MGPVPIGSATTRLHALAAPSASGGKVTTPVGRGSASVSALVRQPDGKLVAAGTGEIGSGMNVTSAYFAVVRYNADGSLDPSFGHGGKVTTSIAKLSSASALVRQPDGKLVAAGVSGSTDSNMKLALARYAGDGSLDASFGHGGTVTTAIGQGVTLTAISAFLVRQPDGKLVAASSGFRGSYSCLALARYNADGSLDLSFGRGGIVTTPVGLLDYSASALVLQPDGKLVVAAGTSSAQGSGGFVLARYNPDGSLDRSFGRGGKVTRRGTTDNDIAEGLVLLPGGGLVAAGAGSYSALTLTAYTRNGTLDASFGHLGTVTTRISPGSITYEGALLLAPDGRLVVAGAADLTDRGPTGFFAARYKGDGSLDTSFGRRGKVTTVFNGNGSHDLGEALLRQPDGKLVVAGSSASRSGYEFALARYTTTGSLDTSFGR